VFGASAASVPPCPSVLPPGAGNKEEPKALEAGKERAKQIDGGYALGLEVAEGHGPAPAVGHHDDDDAAAVATLEEIQATGLPFGPRSGGFAECIRTGLGGATTRTATFRTSMEHPRVRVWRSGP